MKKVLKFIVGLFFKITVHKPIDELTMEEAIEWAYDNPWDSRLANCEHESVRKIYFRKNPEDKRAKFDPCKEIRMDFYDFHKDDEDMAEDDCWKIRYVFFLENEHDQRAQRDPHIEIKKLWYKYHPEDFRMYAETNLELLNFIFELDPSNPLLATCNSDIIREKYFEANPNDHRGLEDKSESVRLTFLKANPYKYDIEKYSIPVEVRKAWIDIVGFDERAFDDPSEEVRIYLYEKNSRDARILDSNEEKAWEIFYDKNKNLTKYISSIMGDHKNELVRKYYFSKKIQGRVVIDNSKKEIKNLYIDGENPIKVPLKEK